MNASKPVLVVGGGLAALACATRLHEAGREVRIVEATDRWGGSVRTDRVDDFLLDHDFFPLRTGGPATQRLLDLDKLRLEPLGEPIAMRSEDRWIEDPSIRFDHSRAAEFREVFAPTQRAAWARPHDGVQAVASQLAGRLPAATRSLRCTIASLARGDAETSDGQRLAYQHVVLACGSSASQRLLDTAGRAPTTDAAASAGRLRTCWYFSAPLPPRPEASIMLFADSEARLGRAADSAEPRDGSASDDAMRITQIHVSGPAPQRSRTAAATLVGVLASGQHAAPWALEGAFRERLEAWFGEDVKRWRSLRGFARKRSAASQVSVGSGESDAHEITVCQRPEGDGIEERLASGCRAADRVLDLLSDP
ncbi:FAD-dependent oxidoreductase [Roseimaritima sediminicola]|uniref:FAD-dependent oxidoreductase n=1 Tax=Roseimaritima sediminicola TaxID=2662066 RepID=UPI0012983F8B|nr:NAD(P)/FAD-dependent oxidoreductase [Roseimaritima sediminicola]